MGTPSKASDRYVSPGLDAVMTRLGFPPVGQGGNLRAYARVQPDGFEELIYSAEVEGTTPTALQEPVTLFSGFSETGEWDELTGFTLADVVRVLERPSDYALLSLRLQEAA